MPESSTSVTITTTEAHVRRFFEIWRQGDIKRNPLYRICPLALAIREATGLPIEVNWDSFHLQGENITLEGLSEPVCDFVLRVNGIVVEMGWEGWKDAALCSQGFPKMREMVPFSFDFDTTGLGENAGNSYPAFFTPGPWSIERDRPAADVAPFRYFFAGTNDDGKSRKVCSFRCWDINSKTDLPKEADLSLMAASPDMFDAIAAVLAYETSLNREECGIPCPTAWTKALECCRGALVKAKGNTK